MNVTMTDEEMFFAGKVGAARALEMQGVANIDSYKEQAMYLSSKQGHQLGVLAEMGVAKALGYNPMDLTISQWPAFYFKEQKHVYDGPDLFGKFEVRRVNNPNNPIAIRTKDYEQDVIVVQAYVDFIFHEDDKSLDVSNVVQVIGYSNVREDWNDAEIPWWCTDRSARVVTNKRDISELLVAA